MLVHNEDKVVKALIIIASCQLKQTQIAEQSFKEAKELRDITMGMMKKTQEESQKLDKELLKFKKID